MSELDADIEKRIDEALHRYIDADAEARETRNTLRRQECDANDAFGEARKLRMALFALNGQSDKAAGDAKVANNDRAQELRRDRR